MSHDFAESRSERLRKLLKSAGWGGVLWFALNGAGFVAGFTVGQVVFFGKGSSGSVSYEESPAGFVVIMCIHAFFVSWALVGLWKALRNDA